MHNGPRLRRQCHSSPTPPWRDLCITRLVFQGATAFAPTPGVSNGVRSQSNQGDAVLHPLHGERQTRPSAAEFGEGSSVPATPPSTRAKPAPIQPDASFPAPVLQLPRALEGSKKGGRDRPKTPGSLETGGEQGRPGPDAGPKPASARPNAGSASLRAYPTAPPPPTPVGIDTASRSPSGYQPPTPAASLTRLTPQPAPV